MSLNFILPAAGFMAAFILLFYFTAKYREASDDGGSFENESASAPEPAAERTGAYVSAAIKRASFNGPFGVLSLEIEDLKEKLRELHYRGEELRLINENRTAEILKSVAKLETRLKAFEEEYVQELQPTLVSLIEDLEKMKK